MGYGQPSHNQRELTGWPSSNPQVYIIEPPTMARLTYWWRHISLYLRQNFCCFIYTSFGWADTSSATRRFENASENAKFAAEVGGWLNAMCVLTVATHPFLNGWYGWNAFNCEKLWTHQLAWSFSKGPHNTLWVPMFDPFPGVSKSPKQPQ